MSLQDCALAAGFTADAAGVSRLKGFVNGAAGSGAEFASAWMREVGLDVLPEWCELYRRTLQECARLDVCANQDGMSCVCNARVH